MRHSLREVRLDNGTQGLVVHIPGVEVVRMLVEFRAGFYLGDWSKFELPHVMEHMMFTNQTYPKPNQFSRQVEKNGAYYNAYTNNTSIEYEYECAAFEAERIAKLINIQVTQPTFPEKEFKTELGNVVEELNNDISSHDKSTVLNLESARTGMPQQTECIEQLNRITTDNLRDFYRRTHRPGNMRFIVAGDIDFDTKVLPHLDIRPGGGERLQVPAVPAKGLTQPVSEERDIPQMYYFIESNLDYPLPYRELVAARFASNILGAGFSSTLLGKAREKGLVYDLNMGVGQDLQETNWCFSGMVTPDHAQTYFELATQEIGKVQAGRISKRQFEATRRLMRGDRARKYQKVSNFVGYYSEYFTLGYTDFNEYNRILDDITTEEVVESFNRLFSEQRWGMSLLGAVDDEAAARYYEQVASLW